MGIINKIQELHKKPAYSLQFSKYECNSNGARRVVNHVYLFNNLTDEYVANTSILWWSDDKRTAILQQSGKTEDGKSGICVLDLKSGKEIVSCDSCSNIRAKNNYFIVGNDRVMDGFDELYQTYCLYDRYGVLVVPALPKNEFDKISNKFFNANTNNKENENTK